LVRPDGYVALADPDASASRLEAYLDARRVRPKSPSRVLVQERQFDHPVHMALHFEIAPRRLGKDSTEPRWSSFAAMPGEAKCSDSG
jgi:hypothetical protein